MPTFREAVHAVHESNTPRWRNARHIGSWIQTLERHAMTVLGNTPLDRIDRGDVLRVLTPIWTTRPETARRVRQRMWTVFRWAMAHGFMETNPAGEAIDGALPPMPKVKAHLRALPYQEVGSALETVDATQASMVAKLCFRFLVFTAARSGEARGATWNEIDLQGKVWRIPAQRMKAGMEHRVPLSRQAQLHRADLRPVRPLRATPSPHAAVGGLPQRVASRNGLTCESPQPAPEANERQGRAARTTPAMMPLCYHYGMAFRALEKGVD